MSSDFSNTLKMVCSLKFKTHDWYAEFIVYWIATRATYLPTHKLSLRKDQQKLT